jgi:hypothetical protein
MGHLGPWEVLCLCIHNIKSDAPWDLMPGGFETGWNETPQDLRHRRSWVCGSDLARNLIPHNVIPSRLLCYPSDFGQRVSNIMQSDPGDSQTLWNHFQLLKIQK